MNNHLNNQTSPYLLQHAQNPVEWYPWSKEAFDRAKSEDKPVFLSIGYSTCHWCHVMAHESFENQEIADILNQYFISIKVDKEERPDIDSVYMTVCQTFTGSGGWPTSIFMTASQKPFFAGTYFPKTSYHGLIGFKELLLAISEKWKSDRAALLHSAEEFTVALNRTQLNQTHLEERQTEQLQTEEKLLTDAVHLYRQSYDSTYGGFGKAPKFPAAHNLLFLMKYYQTQKDEEVLMMVEKTLIKMYTGGIFDHIGYGFCRYSTDQYFLVPHFEKMLYDNALLVLAYCKAYEITKKPLYRAVAEKIVSYILREMTSHEGAFFSAQDADSDGEEGKFYLFKPEEIVNLLGEEIGKALNCYFGITQAGNFEEKNIPNLLNTECLTDEFDSFLPKIRAYRCRRNSLLTDDKILTAWNSLMIAALCALYRISRKELYLDAAKKAQSFIERELLEKSTLYVSYRSGKKGSKGFLDDYATYAFALLSMYDATLDMNFLDRAENVINKTLTDFFDSGQGGFYLYGRDNEKMIFRPKESYDGAMPSGNSIMTYNLMRLNFLKPNAQIEKSMYSQIDFMSNEAKNYPTGYAMFLFALSGYLNPSQMITVVLKDKADMNELPFITMSDSIIRVFDKETEAYKLLNDKTTYYICQNHSCMPPVNELV